MKIYSSDQERCDRSSISTICFLKYTCLCVCISIFNQVFVYVLLSPLILNFFNCLILELLFFLGILQHSSALFFLLINVFSPPVFKQVLTWLLLISAYFSSIVFTWATSPVPLYLTISYVPPLVLYCQHFLNSTVKLNQKPKYIKV